MKDMSMCGDPMLSKQSILHILSRAHAMISRDDYTIADWEALLPIVNMVYEEKPEDDDDDSNDTAANANVHFEGTPHFDDDDDDNHQDIISTSSSNTSKNITSEKAPEHSSQETGNTVLDEVAAEQQQEHNISNNVNTISFQPLENKSDKKQRKRKHDEPMQQQPKKNITSSNATNYRHRLTADELNARKVS